MVDSGASPARARAGFTLIELVVVVLVLGILAALALPRLDSARERAHFSSISQDFRNLGAAQERHFQANMEYAQDLQVLDFSPSPGVQVEVTEATSDGWAAVGTHDALAGDQGCGIYLGEAQPPSLPNGSAHGSGDGVVACTE